MDYLKRISESKSQMELDDVVEEFLESIGEDEKSNSETYEETAERFIDEQPGEPCAIMNAAIERWYNV